MPSLGVDVRGKLGAAESAEPGRAVARFTDLALGARVRAALRADAPVPPDLIAAAVKVLAAWDWADAPGRGRRDRLGDPAALWSPTSPRSWPASAG